MFLTFDDMIFQSDFQWQCAFANRTTVYLDKSGPKMFLLFSPLIDEKISSFLTYLKSWWKVVLVFGKEHADWSNIGGVMIGWSWKIKFGKLKIGVTKK